MVSPGAVVVPAFLASAVEVIEMAVIVIGVGATRGYRSTLLGAAGGAGVLTVLIAVLGTALTAVPIDALRLVVGALLLVFGLQWLRKGIVRVAAPASPATRAACTSRTSPPPESGIDWTAFVLAFKGVLLEGVEVAFIAVSFGATAHALGPAIIGAAAAVVVVGALAAAFQAWVRRIPRSVLQLAVGLMLTSFGTFWSAEGVGVDWPGEDAAIVGLLVLYGCVAGAAMLLLRRRAPQLAPGARDQRAARLPALLVPLRDRRRLGPCAAAVALGLVATWALVRAGVTAWWLLPLVVVLSTAVSLQRHRTRG